jgi:hypothetical protein
VKKKPFPWGILDEVILEITGPRQDMSLAERSLVDALQAPQPSAESTPRILQFPVSRESYTKGD